MKFRLHTVWLTESKEILKKYPTLKEFSIETVGDKLYITLKDLEDLTKLSVKCGAIILFSEIESILGEPTIEIYDDYRE